MANNRLRKNLGQVDADATTDTILIRGGNPPAFTQTVTEVQALYVCNRGAAEATFRIATVTNSTATSNQDYIFYDVPLPANDTFSAPVKLYIETGHYLTVYASTGDLTFSAYGMIHDARDQSP